MQLYAGILKMCEDRPPARTCGKFGNLHNFCFLYIRNQTEINQKCTRNQTEMYWKSNKNSIEIEQRFQIRQKSNRNQAETC